MSIERCLDTQGYNRIMKKFFNAMKNKNQDKEKGLGSLKDQFTNVDPSRANKKDSHVQQANSTNSQINPNSSNASRNQFNQNQRYYQKGFKDSEVDNNGLFSRFLQWWASFVRRRITEPFEKTLLSVKVFGKVMDRKFSITDSFLHTMENLSYVYNHREEYKNKMKNRYHEYQNKFVNYGDRKFLKGISKIQSLKNKRTRFWMYTGGLTVLCISAAVMGAKLPGMYMNYKIQHEIKELEKQKQELLQKTKQRNSQVKTENVKTAEDKG